MSPRRSDSIKTTSPLKGVRILVGRARHQASALSSELRRFGAEVIEIPFIEIRKPLSFRPLDSAIKNLHTYDWLILTSVNGVEAMWDRMGTLGSTTVRKGTVSAWAGGSLRIAAIGPATKKAIEERGGTVSVVPKEYVAESVVRSLRRRVNGKRVLLVRAKVARDVIPRELRKAGAHVDVVEAYETVIPKASRLRLRKALNDPDHCVDVVTFTSSSTARNFVALLGGARTAEQLLGSVDDHSAHVVQLASIGPITSATLRQLGLRVDVEAEEYTIPGLVKAIVNVAGNPSKPHAARAKS